MKLIIAIVQDEDASRLVSSLMNEGFGVTAGDDRWLSARRQHDPAGRCGGRAL